MLKNITMYLLNHKKVIQLVIGIFALVLAIWIVFLNFESLEKLLYFQLWNVVAIFLLFILMFLLASIPLWLIIVNISGKRLPLSSWIKMWIVSRMANNLVPKSGAVYKAYVLNNEHDINYIKFFHIYSFFTWFSIFVNMFFLTLLISILAPTMKMGDFNVLPIMTIITFIVAITPWAIKFILGFIKTDNNYLSSILKIVHDIINTIKLHGSNLVFMSRLFGLQVVNFCLAIILFKLIFTGMNIDMGYAELSFFVVIKQISVIIYITPGNIGVRELLYGVVGGALGIGITEGLIASALLRVVNYIVIFTFGIAFGGLKVYRSIKTKKYPAES